MKIYHLIIIFFFTTAHLGVHASSTTSSINIEAEFEVRSYYDKIDYAKAKQDGWIISKDKFGDEKFSLNIKIESSKLPLSKPLGSANLFISKLGLVKIGMSVGDADASTSAELQLPRVQNKLAPLPAPLSLVNSGGSHADGTWYFRGKVLLTVTK